MDLTLEQYLQFQKNQEINPITGKKIQIGKKTHELLTFACSRYIDKSSDKNVFAVIEVNFEPNLNHSYQQHFGLFSNLETAFGSMMVQIVDNLSYQRENISTSVVKHLIYQYQINSEFVPIQKWRLNLENKKYQLLEIKEMAQKPEKVRHLLTLF